MQGIETNMRRYLQKLQTPEFIIGTASGVSAALSWETASEGAQSSLNYQIVGYYLIAVIALICLILIGNFLMRIEKPVENRNHVRFITSKATRLNLMAKCIKNAKSSIYVISGH